VYLQEQLENENRFSESAFSLLKLTENELKRIRQQWENIASILAKQLKMKDGVLQSNNEKIEQLYDTIYDLRKKEGANNRTLQELREEKKQLQATIDGQTKTE
jgi:phosphotransacetylase